MLSGTLSIILSSISVVFTSTGSVGNDTCQNGKLFGYYRHTQDSIYVCNQTIPKEIDRVIAHESAHWIYFQHMTQKERDRWVERSRKISSMYSNSFVSEYARTNEVEDFAETYAYIVTERPIYDEAIYKAYYVRYLVKNALKRIKQINHENR